MRAKRVWRGVGLLAAMLLVWVAVGRGEPRAAGAPCLTLYLAGDVMLGRGMAQALEGDWPAAFAGVRPLLDADSDCAHSLVLANLESPLTTAPQLAAGFDLRAEPAAVAALNAGGFHALSLANNHALDAGKAGLRDTARALTQVGIAPWIEGAAADPLGGRSSYAGLAFDDSAAPLDVEAASAAVAAAAKRADVVIISIHWGGEYQAAPSARQRAIARALAAAGAAVIAGHGPHVLQPVEWEGETLVAYSLGNLLFDQPYPADCRQGAILRVVLRDGRASGIEVLPTVCERGRVYPAPHADAAAILARLLLEPRAINTGD